MTIDQLYRGSAGNSHNVKALIDRECRSVIEKQAVRLLGRAPKELVDHVLRQTQLRLFDVAGDCDVNLLAFDCLRKEIFSQLRERSGMPASVPNPILREYVPCKEKTDEGKRLDVALALMTGKQREYFFYRYYFLNQEVPYQKKFEKSISDLFSGKGMAAHRFRYFGIATVPATPSLYLDCLCDLDPFYISRLGDIRSSAHFVKSSGLPWEWMYTERLMRHFGYVLHLLPVLLLLVVVFLVWMFFSLVP